MPINRLISAIDDNRCQSMTIDNHTHLDDRLFIDYQYQSINWHRLSSNAIDSHRSSISSIGYALNNSLKEISPTSLCIWWQTLIKESQPISDAFFHFFKNLGWSRILGLTPPFWICHYLPGVLGEFSRQFSKIAEDNWERGWCFSAKFPGMQWCCYK